MTIAHIVCNKCRAMWHDGPGAFATHKSCPLCGGIYWKWMNYKDRHKSNNYCGICEKSFSVQ
jgi:hypothetical protein